MSLDRETLDESLNKGVGSFKDTTDPQFVTEWLSGILRGIGEPLDTPRIYKRTRDEVLWAEGSLEPWRRSPRWILLRVATQTTLAGSVANHIRYKVFMIYFMATVVDLAVQHKYPSDVLYVMLAKMNRRVQKLGTVITDLSWAEGLHEFITETMESARNCIAKRWDVVQKSRNSAGVFRLAELKKLKPQDNTVLQLPHLRPYLQSLHSAQIAQRAEITFDGKCSARIKSKEISLPNLELLIGRSDSETRIGLMDLELWVSASLESWLDKHITSTKEMSGMSRLANWYMSKAVSVYAESPEEFSVMVLTLMLFWVALDKATVSSVRSPEFFKSLRLTLFLIFSCAWHPFQTS